jgi:hypothetical protein
MGEGSWVGLDVHARSTVASVLDGCRGELRTLRVPPQGGQTVEWLRALPRPARVAYEAAPTGYGRARVRRGGDRLHGRGAVEDPACAFAMSARVRSRNQ